MTIELLKQENDSLKAEIIKLKQEKKRKYFPTMG
jgi:cell division protein FtsB